MKPIKRIGLLPQSTINVNKIINEFKNGIFDKDTLLSSLLLEESLSKTNIYSYKDNFLMLKTMLKINDILTEEQINDLIDAGHIMDKLTKE